MVIMKITHIGKLNKYENSNWKAINRIGLSHLYNRRNVGKSWESALAVASYGKPLTFPRIHLR